MTMISIPASGIFGGKLGAATLTPDDLISAFKA